MTEYYAYLLSENDGRTFRQMGIVDTSTRQKIEESPISSPYVRRFRPSRKPAGFTPRRTVRIDSDLWEAVHAKAAAEDRTATDVIIEALRRYTRTPSKAP